MRNTRDLTIGAMFGAIYGVLLLLVRYLFTSTDSLIYYFLPIPIAIYTYWKNSKNGFLLLAVSVALSFLICDPYRALLLLTPNFMIGYLFGILKNKPTIFLLITTFIASLLANFMSIYAFELLSGVPYLEYMSMDYEMLNISSMISSDLFSQILVIILPIVLIIDSLMKTFIIYLVFFILSKRLNLSISPFQVKITFAFGYTIAYVGLFILTVLYLGSGKIFEVGIWQWFGIIILSCFFLYSFYILYLGIIGFNYFYLRNAKYRLLLIFLCVLVMPIGIIFGLVLNVIKHNNVIMLRG